MQTRLSPKDKIKEMIRNLHKNGLLDNPYYVQTIRDKAKGLCISDEEINKLIDEVKIEEMIRDLHKNGLLDEPSHQETLKKESTKLGISDEELKNLIKEITKTTPPPPPRDDEASNDNETSNGEKNGENNRENNRENNGGNNNPLKEYIPYIIGAAVVVIALLIWILWTKVWPKEPTEVDKNGKEDSTEIVKQKPPEELDPRLKQLIQDGEDVFKTKNVARAKRLFKEALNEFPNNQEVLRRIVQCDEILGRSDYQTLHQVYENNKIGFADKDGYIVVDFLYTKQMERKHDMMLLKDGDKLGVVGGKLKDFTETKYIEAKWVKEENSYRMVKDSTGDCDFVLVENGKLIIKEY